MNLLNHRHCRARRHPYARYTRQSLVAQKCEARTGREQGPRGYRILVAGRSLRATGSEVQNAARAKWRNWEWCMSRVCNSVYRMP